MRAVEAASDALYREKREPRLETDSDREQAAAQRRADALGLLAERAMAVGFGGRGGAESDSGAECSADCCAESDDQIPISGTRAERFQVMLHVEPETLKAEGEPGCSELEDGTRVSAETSRRLACDAAVVEIGHDSGGSILDVGRKTRSIPPSVRRALEVRDRGCRFPGCGLRFTDAHHIKHWADGGDTKLGNLLLLCSHHHRLLHEEGWKIEWWGKDRNPAFIDPKGQTHLGRPREAPELEPDPVAALIAQTRSRGADPDFYTAGARWKREADIPDDVYFRAMEAIG